MKTTRLEKAEIAARLHKRGYMVQQIADEMGISRSYAGGLLTDPDGSLDRQRKLKYHGTCEICGGRTSPKNTGGAHKRCSQCQIRHPRRYWTKEKIIEAIQRFAKENGRRPTATEWLGGKWRIALQGDMLHGRNGSGYPYVATVLYHFGSWANAIEAAGFERPTVGQYVVRDRSEAARQAAATRRGRGEKKASEPWSLEETVKLVKKLSPWGVAPKTTDPRVRVRYKQAQKNGITWREICEQAGVRPRSDRPYT